MNPMIYTAIIAIISAFIAFLVAVYNQFQARKQKREDNFFSALDWLTGNTQRRNVGIAAVEFFWRGASLHKDQTERFRSLSIDALSNTAMYLLLQSGQGIAAHESNNLSRIMTFLLGVTPEEAGKHASQYGDLYRAIQEAQKRKKEHLDKAGVETEEDFLSEVRTWSAKSYKEYWEHQGLWVEQTRLEKWQKS